ncbi:MAG: mechanosensitive ion channel domain-containing protein, partial [Chloroflexota bacterium]
KELDWTMILTRGFSLIAVWGTIWLVRRFIIKWLETPARDKSERLSPQDRNSLALVVNIILIAIGITLTLIILQLGSWFLVGVVGPKLLALVAVWVVVWVLVRYLSRWIQSLDERIEEIDIDPRDIDTIDRMVDVAIIVIGIIASLAILDLVSLLYSMLTAAGIASLVLGLAVKDIAANIIAGIFLLLDRPFVVGDVIQIKGFTGAVEQISLRTTHLVTSDGPQVIIPNSIMVVEPTTNYTKSINRRVLFSLQVLGTANLDRVFELIQGTLDAESRLLAEPQPTIRVDNVQDGVVSIQIIAYAIPSDLLEIQALLQKRLVEDFQQANIQFAAPLRINLAAPDAPAT